MTTGSFSKIKTITLGVAAAAVVAMSGNIITADNAEARSIAKVKPKAFGIGYSYSRHGAARNSRLAWKKAVRRAYGHRYTKFYNARNKRIRCERIGFGSRFKQLRRFGSVFATVGNPNSPWTCTTSANPVRFGHVGPSPYPDHPGYKPTATGIGYGRTQAGARGLAVRAWTNAVRRAYGSRYDSFNAAKGKRMSCEHIGRNYRGLAKKYGRRGVIGSAGNPGNPWTCTVTARPKYSRY